MKENLILIPGFQTNSIILKDLIDYMNEFYNVYFIDLPGFNINLQAFDDISIKTFTDYIQQEIKNLNLNSYIIGGISFGFIILNYLNLDSHCKAILAIEPFLGLDSIGVSRSKLAFLKLVERIINKFKLYKPAFFLGSIRPIQLLLTGGKEHSIQLIINSTDPKTYFETAKILFNVKNFVFRKNSLPCVLLMNPSDCTLNYDYVVNQMKQNTSKLLVINMDMEHFPINLGKDYFAIKLPGSIFKKIDEFVG